MRSGLRRAAAGLDAHFLLPMCAATPRAPGQRLRAAVASSQRARGLPSSLRHRRRRLRPRQHPRDARRQPPAVAAAAARAPPLARRPQRLRQARTPTRTRGWLAGGQAQGLSPYRAPLLARPPAMTKKTRARPAKRGSGRSALIHCLPNPHFCASFGRSACRIQTPFSILVLNHGARSAARAARALRLPRRRLTGVAVTHRRPLLRFE